MANPNDKYLVSAEEFRSMFEDAIRPMTKGSGSSPTIQRREKETTMREQQDPVRNPTLRTFQDIKENQKKQHDEQMKKLVEHVRLTHKIEITQKEVEKALGQLKNEIDTQTKTIQSVVNKALSQAHKENTKEDDSPRGMQGSQREERRVTSIVEAISNAASSMQSAASDLRSASQNVTMAAAQASASGGMTAVIESPTGNMGSVNVLKAAQAAFKGTMTPAQAVNSAAGDIATRFVEINASANSMADNLYRHSILPEMKKHIESVIESMTHLVELFDKMGDEDLGIAAAAGRGGGGGGSPGKRGILSPESAISETLQQGFEQISDRLGKEFEGITNDFIKAIQSAGEGRGGGGEGAGVSLESFGGTGGRQSAQEFLRGKSFAARTIQAREVIDVFLSFEALRGVREIVDLGKEINNIQGGMTQSVELAREFRQELVSSLGKIRADGGFTIQQLSSSVTSIMDAGIVAKDSVSEVSEIALYGARAIGEEVGTIASQYANISRTLRLNNREINLLVASTLKISRQTGMTSKHIAEIQRGAEDLVQSFRETGNVSAGLLEDITQMRALSERRGTGDFVENMIKKFQSFQSYSENFDMISALTTEKLVQNGNNNLDVIQGVLANSVSGMREIRSALIDTLKNISPKMPRMALENLTGIKSHEMRLELIRSLEEMNETGEERLKRLQKIQKQFEDTKRKEGESVAQSVLSISTGGQSRTLNDLLGQIDLAKKDIGSDREKVAVDLMSQIARMNQDMGMSFRQAFQSKKIQDQIIQTNLKISNFDDLKALNESAVQRAEKAVKDGAEAGTQNLPDQVAIGVQKGMQKVLGFFIPFIDAFENSIIGPFVSSVAKFGTAVIMLASLLGGLRTLQSQIPDLLPRFGGRAAREGMEGTTTGMLGKIKDTLFGKGRPNASHMPAGSTVGGGIPSPAGVAGEATGGALDKTASMSESMVPAVQRIGDAGQALFKNIPKMLLGIAAITTVGVAIAGATYVLTKVFPASGDVLEVAKSVGASAIALGILAVEAFALGAAGMALTGSLPVLLMGALGFAVALAGLVVVGFAIGAAMKALGGAFPPVSEIQDTSASILASAKAMLALTAAAGVLAISMPVAAISALLAPIGLIALTAVGKAIAIEIVKLSEEFKDINPEEVQQTANLISSAASAFSTLAEAGRAFMSVSISQINPLARLFSGDPIAGLSLLSKLGKEMLLEIRNMGTIGKSEKDVREVADALISTSEAYKTLASASTLLADEGWKNIKSLNFRQMNISKGLNSLADLGEEMVIQILPLKRNFDDKSIKDIETISKGIRSSAATLTDLAEAAQSISKAEGIVGKGWFFSDRTQKIIDTIGELKKVSDSIGAQVNTLNDSNIDQSKLEELVRRAEAVEKMASIIENLSNASSKFVDEWFDGMNAVQLMQKNLQDIITLLNSEQTDLTDLITAINGLPTITDENNENLGRVGQGIEGVLKMIQDIADIHKKYPPPSSFGLDFGEIGLTVGNIVFFLADEKRGLKGIANALGTIPNIEDKTSDLDKGIANIYSVMNRLKDIQDMSPMLATYLLSIPGFIESVNIAARQIDIGKLNSSSAIISKVNDALRPFQDLSEILKMDVPSSDEVSRSMQNLRRGLDWVSQHLDPISASAMKVKAKIPALATAVGPDFQALKSIVNDFKEIRDTFAGVAEPPKEISVDAFFAPIEDFVSKGMKKATELKAAIRSMGQMPVSGQFASPEEVQAAINSVSGGNALTEAEVQSKNAQPVVAPSVIESGMPSQATIASPEIVGTTRTPESMMRMGGSFLSDGPQVQGEVEDRLSRGGDNRNLSKQTDFLDDISTQSKEQTKLLRQLIQLLTSHDSSIAPGRDVNTPPNTYGNRGRTGLTFPNAWGTGGMLNTQQFDIGGRAEGD